MSKLGSYLKEQREKQEISLETLHEETKIRKLYLSSIENGEYSALPGEVYLKGFLRSISRELSLDYAHLLKLYSDDTGVKHYDSSNDLVTNNTLKEIESEKKTQRRFLLIIGGLIIMSVAVVAFMLLYN